MFAIGEAARQSGVSIETIRYYEREGIVPKTGRDPSGRRVFSLASIARLRFIKRCRDLGFTIADARTLQSLAQSDDSECVDVLDLSERHLAAIRQKITELEQLETALQELTANCADGRVFCPMLEQLGS